MQIDSHVHFWKYDKKRYDWIDDNMKILQKDYLPEHISSTLNRNGIGGLIFVRQMWLIGFSIFRSSPLSGDTGILFSRNPTISCSMQRSAMVSLNCNPTIMSTTSWYIPSS